MSALGGAVGGFLALTLLEVAVTSSQATASTNAIVALVSKAIDRLVDPTLPLIPNLTNYGANGSPGASVILGPAGSLITDTGPLSAINLLGIPGF